MASEPLEDAIQRVLRDAPFAMRQLASESGISYDVLRSWRSGRRRPSRNGALRLAAGLEQRGEQLIDLSQKLRGAASDGNGERSSSTNGS